MEIYVILSCNTCLAEKVSRKIQYRKSNLFPKRFVELLTKLPKELARSFCGVSSLLMMRMMMWKMKRVKMNRKKEEVNGP